MSDINDTYFHVAIYLAKLAYIFKNPFFYEEKEWRIMHTPLLLGDTTSNVVTNNKGKIISSISSCYFRCMSSTISPYFTLPIDEKENNVHPINEIVIGPKSRLERDYLMMFLEENKFWGISVKNSEIPYR